MDSLTVDHCCTPWTNNQQVVMTRMSSTLPEQFEFDNVLEQTATGTTRQWTIDWIDVTGRQRTGMLLECNTYELWLIRLEWDDSIDECHLYSNSCCSSYASRHLFNVLRRRMAIGEWRKDVLWRNVHRRKKNICLSVHILRKTHHWQIVRVSSENLYSKTEIHVSVRCNRFVSLRFDESTDTWWNTSSYRLSTTVDKTSARAMMTDAMTRNESEEECRFMDDALQVEKENNRDVSRLSPDHIGLPYDVHTSFIKHTISFQCISRITNDFTCRRTFPLIKTVQNSIRSRH
jgi:hypothetical protein